METITKAGHRKGNWRNSKVVRLQALWVDKKMTIVEITYPCYLHGLYCYTTHAIGTKSSFAALAITMCMKSNSPGERRKTISIDICQLWAWFTYDNG